MHLQNIKNLQVLDKFENEKYTKFDSIDLRSISPYFDKFTKTEELNVEQT